MVVMADDYDVVDCDVSRGTITCHEGCLARSGRRLTMNHRFYQFDRVWGKVWCMGELHVGQVDFAQLAWACVRAGVAAAGCRQRGGVPAGGCCMH